MCFGLIYTDNLLDGISLIQRSLSLLLFPIIFLFVKEDAATVKKLFNFLLAGLIASFFINFFNATQDLTAYILEKNISIDIFSLLEEISNGWHYFFIGSFFSRSVNSNYISIYILLVLSYYLKNKLESRIQLTIIVILFLYLFLLSSVGGYIILAIMSVFLIMDVKSKSKKYTFIIILIMGTILFLNNPRIINFYSRIKHLSKTLNYENNTSEKLKVLSWDTSLKLIKEAPVFGYGTGDANDVLLEKYKKLGYNLNYGYKYNSHNQFFQTYLQTGFFGFFVLISIFILLAIRMKRSRNEFSVFLILFISLLFESMLVRFNGIVFFSIVIPLLLKKRSILSSRIIRNDNPEKNDL
ncbi:O-antigen ligase family protein [Aquimarina muelleri]|uniref:O-antigen ligase-related domain-containing protein n=1 Tax=Aquimarina muelleri TaxID=279356 RepID=A0A918JYB9_9FLAO|nr:O-antigen ligase family protein [Aquimarina muelleri]MCX2764293.1 O-antigen ligase family protein [Aquimarina muelleri]GGX32165.1 hypothetical protein GCM10007384_36370 [Aquimarina muelleri]